MALPHRSLEAHVTERIIPDDPTPEANQLELPLSASVVLNTLPEDVHSALERLAQHQVGVPAKGGLVFELLLTTLNSLLKEE